MVKPTRQSVLKMLDALFAEENAAPSGVGVRLQSFRAQQSHWIRDRRIVGYGFPGKGGYFANDKSTAKIAVYVDHEDDVTALAGEMPTSLHMPGLDAPLGAEVINIGEMRPLSARCRPIICGMSVSHIDMRSGTLGAIVTLKGCGPDEYFVMSANHVLTQHNRLSVGDVIIQPGKSDRGKTTDKIAELSHAVELQFRDEGFPNVVDAALGRITEPSCLAEGFGDRSTSTIERNLRRGAGVRMYGRTSGLAVGQMMDISARLAMSYPRDARSSGRIGFQDVVLCTPFTQAGDSGAIVTNESDKVVGLVIGGSSKASVFCKIGNVVDMLDIDAIRIVQ